MRNKAFPLFIQLSLILIFSANIFAQNRTYGDRAALVTRSRVSETSSKKTASVFELERVVFNLINEKRTEIGLDELNWNEDLAKVARLHSQNMASSKFFSHQGLDGSRVDDRAESLGVRRWQAIGENIASNRGYADPTEVAVASWMKSAGHRANILNNSWEETGIGIAFDDNGKYYFTQVFLLRR